MVSVSVMLVAAGFAATSALAQVSTQQTMPPAQQSDSGVGGTPMTGSVDTGYFNQHMQPPNSATCVGPIGYCEIYFGS
jgi:hypothetical protein